MCYEDLAVIKKDKEICYQAYKPSKDDVLFKEYIKENQNKSEDELFEEYSKAFEEYAIEYKYCQKYYDNAIRVIDEKISHCVDTHSGESDSYRCYPKLIKNFKSVSECDYYTDLQKNDNEFDTTEKYGEEHNQCYAWYAGLHNDTSICYNMKTQIQKTYCLGQYAHIRREPKYCEEIEDKRIKDLCISYANEKPRYCSEYLEKDVCDKILVQYTNMRTCEEIKDSSENDRCITEVINNIKYNMETSNDYCYNNEDSPVCIWDVSLIIEDTKPKLVVIVYSESDFSTDFESVLCKSMLNNQTGLPHFFTECKMSFSIPFHVDVGNHTYTLDYQESEEWTKYVMDGGYLSVPYFRVNKVYDSDKGFAGVSSFEFNNKNIKIN